MTREYSEFINPTRLRHLEGLLHAAGDPRRYQQLMRELGHDLGEVIVRRLDATGSVLVVCTAEDADFLTRGMLDELKESLSPEQVHLACFWNQRSRWGESHPVRVAPIIRKYVEPFNPDDIQTVIVTKSIISSGCTVRTNLTEMLEQVKPQRIFVAAPVLYSSSQEVLAEEFPPEISERFTYIFLAEDSERDADGIIRPGIGGEVYGLLGFDGQEGKNRYLPEIVKRREDELWEKQRPSR